MWRAQRHRVLRSRGLIMTAAHMRTFEAACTFFANSCRTDVRLVLAVTVVAFAFTPPLPTCITPQVNSTCAEICCLCGRGVRTA